MIIIIILNAKEVCEKKQQKFQKQATQKRNTTVIAVAIIRYNCFEYIIIVRVRPSKGHVTPIP